MSDAAAIALFVGVVLYGIFGGADFGAGFWDLTAGGAERGRPIRDLIDHSIGPVWEANHVWLVYCLVILWTAFPSAFASITTTLPIPLGLAAMGIVLRGSGFAFRKALVGTSNRRVAGVVFALSSIVTPFFLGAAAGAIASGRVPGDVGTWVNPTSLLGGALAVVTCAYLAAVFLTAEARRRGEVDLERAFHARSLVSSGAAGAIAVAGIAVLHADAHRLYEQLLGPGLPFVIVSALAGGATLVAGPRFVRPLAVAAVSAILIGWAAAQYPYLLGTHLAISRAAAPRGSLWAVLLVFGTAALVCVPSIAYLYALEQRGRLDPA